MVAIRWIFENPEIASIVMMGVIGLVIGKRVLSSAQHDSETLTEKYRIITPEGESMTELVPVDPKDNVDSIIEDAIAGYKSRQMPIHTA